MSEKLRIHVEPPHIELKPGGEPAQLKVRVFNVSTIVDAFRIDVPTAPEWLDVRPAEVRLLPGTDEVLEVELSIPDVPVRAHDGYVYVEVRSVANPSVAEGHDVGLTVAARDSSLSLDLQPQVARVRDGQPADLEVVADNSSGNLDLDLALAGSDPEGVVRFRFDPAVLYVPAHGSARAGVRLRAPAPRRGREASRQLTVTATDERQAQRAEASGTLVQTSVDRSPMVRAVLRAALILAGGAAIIAGSFMPWAAGRAGSAWTVFLYAEAIGVPLTPLRADVQAALPSVLISAGLVTIVLGALTMLGATGPGRLTRFGAIVSVLAVIAFVFVLSIGAGVAMFGTGVSVIIAGAIAAFIGSLIRKP